MSYLIPQLQLQKHLTCVLQKRRWENWWYWWITGMSEMSQKCHSFPVTEAFDFCTNEEIGESSCHCWYVRDMGAWYTLEQNQLQLWKTEVGPLPCSCFVGFFLNRGLITGLTDVLLSIPVQGWESYTKSIHIYKGIKTLSIYARLAVYLLILCIFVL